MKFCQRHWDMMRAAVTAMGMEPLVASGGEAAVANLVDEIAHGATVDNFDPLMAMHWNIATNLLGKLGSSGLYLMSDGPEDAIDVEQLREEFRDKYQGKTWPRCPVCYANIAHEISCRETRCALTQVDGWDVCIAWSAETIKAEFDAMMKKKEDK
jgi:hypothetical protein